MKLMLTVAEQCAYLHSPELDLAGSMFDALGRELFLKAYRRQHVASTVRAKLARRLRQAAREAVAPKDA